MAGETEVDTEVDTADIQNIMFPSDIPVDIREEVSSMVKEFAVPDKKALEEAQKIKDYSDKVVMEAVKGETEKEKSDISPKELCSHRVQYLISFSMPEKTIITLINDAISINTLCSKHIVTLGIRGFIENSMKKTLGYLAKISDTVQKDLPLFLNPDTFRQYKVTSVPFIVVENNSKSKKIVRGDVSIDYAIHRASDNEVTGQTYPVIEEDFNSFMAKRAEEATKRVFQTMNNNRPSSDMYTVTGYEKHFKKVEKERVFYLDPAYVAEDNITDDKGNVIIPKGTTIYPHEYTSLGRYIVIDGNDEKEIEFALAGNFRKIIVVSGNPLELTAQYKEKTAGKHKFYAANDLLVYGLSLERTPSIIEQEGRFIRVTEKKIK